MGRLRLGRGVSAADTHPEAGPPHRGAGAGIPPVSPQATRCPQPPCSLPSPLPPPSASWWCSTILPACPPGRGSLTPHTTPRPPFSGPSALAGSSAELRCTHPMAPGPPHPSPACHLAPPRLILAEASPARSPCPTPHQPTATCPCWAPTVAMAPGASAQNTIQKTHPSGRL